MFFILFSETLTSNWVDKVEKQIHKREDREDIVEPFS